jgi:hypothetical protein
MTERITFGHPVHGIGLTIAAGSGRSWMEEPGGDPRHAHLHLDVPSDTLIPVPAAPGPRLRSGTVLVAWNEVLRFSDALEALAGKARGEVALGGPDRHATLIVRLRSRELQDTGVGAGGVTARELQDGELQNDRVEAGEAKAGEVQAEAWFAVGHHVDLEMRCRTRWVGGDIASLADQVVRAVRATRPAR